MQLTFNASYLSIGTFPTVDLPDFTVVTGANGAGKTHLLKAIVAGSVSADVAPNPGTDIKFFDWSTLVPNDAGEFQTNALYQDRDKILEIANNARKKHIDPLNQWGAKYGVTARNRWDLLREEKNDFAKAIANESQVEVAWDELQAIGINVFNEMKVNLRREADKLALLEDLKQRIGLGIVHPYNKDFVDDTFPRTRLDMFQQSFAHCFWHISSLKSKTNCVGHKCEKAKHLSRRRCRQRSL